MRLMTILAYQRAVLESIGGACAESLARAKERV